LEKDLQKEIPKSELEWFERYIAGVKWKQAKSMPNIPHSYTVRDWQPDTFEQAALFIRHYGIGERFWSKTYVYFYYEEYKYWTMGFPIEETIIINRAKADTHYGYED